jgi:hypothetical protein
MKRSFWELTTHGRASLAFALIGGILAMSAYWLTRPSSIGDDLIAGRYAAAYAKLAKAADAGDARAMNYIGNMHYLGLGVDQDYAAALRWYKKAALKGSISARVNAGHIYSQGLGQPKDIMRAYAWFIHARAGGSDAANNYLREILGGFEVVPNMMQRAQELYPNVEALAR